MEQHQMSNALAIFINAVNMNTGMPKEEIIEKATDHGEMFYQYIDKLEKRLQGIHSDNGQNTLEVKAKEIPALDKGDINPNYNPNTAVTDDYITCAFCMQNFDQLGGHLKRKHGIKAKDYKRILGLPQNFPLMSKKRAKEAQDNINRIREQSPTFQTGKQRKLERQAKEAAQSTTPTGNMTNNPETPSFS